MDSYYIIALRIDHRTSNAVKVQEILTKHGCNIRTRIGLHEADAETCADDGLIILQACGDIAVIQQMLADFDALDGVRAKMLDLN